MAGITGAIIGYPVVSLLEFGVEQVGRLYHPPGALVWQANDQAAEPECSDMEYCGNGVYFLLENSGDEILRDISVNFRKPIVNIYRDPIITVTWKPGSADLQIPSIPGRHIFGILLTGVEKADIAGVWADGRVVDEGNVELFGQKIERWKARLVVFLIVTSILSTILFMASLVAAWIFHKEVEVLKRSSDPAQS